MAVKVVKLEVENLARESTMTTNSSIKMSIGVKVPS